MAPPIPHPRHPLAELILNRCAEKGWSLAEVSVRAGYSRNYLDTLTKRDVKRPSAKVIEALARALELPVAQVQSAASRSAGYRIQELAMDDPDLRTIIATAQELTPKGRRQLARIAEVILNETRDEFDN